MHGKKFYNYKIAFTLAEVLVTLGIIGVVAALTLPSLIQNYKIHVYVSKLNKFYSVVSNAYIRAKQDNGDINNWNLVYYESSTKNEEDILYYLLPYMNYLKFCGKNEEGCFPDVAYKSIGSTSYGINLNQDSRHSKAILNDGMLIDSLTFEPPCSNTIGCGLLRIDVNGSAPPNTLGIDLFTFVVFEDKVLPGGLKGVLDTNYNITRGDACTAQVIYGKNMDYIKDKQCKIWE